MKLDHLEQSAVWPERPPARRIFYEVTPRFLLVQLPLNQQSTCIQAVQLPHILLRHRKRLLDPRHISSVVESHDAVLLGDLLVAAENVADVSLSPTEDVL